MIHSANSSDAFFAGAGRVLARTFPALRRMSSFAFASFASSAAFLARFSFILSRSSISFCCFSSSVSGLICSAQYKYERDDDHNAKKIVCAPPR